MTISLFSNQHLTGGTSRQQKKKTAEGAPPSLILDFCILIFALRRPKARVRLVSLGLLAAACAAQVSPDCRLVPGWQQHGPSRSFTADNLFEYMNGNAEGYLIYDFVAMKGVTCKSGGDTFVFDVSQMADAELAYGIFAANRDPRLPVEKIGMAGQVQPRRAIFAKDKYFVEVAASPEKDHTASLRAFVTAMEKRIPGQADLPAALTWFPPEGLDAQSIRLVPQSVLGLRLLKRGYVAQYGFGKAFVVVEPSPEAAAATLNKLRARFGETQAANVADEAFQFTDKYLGRLCFFRKGRYLAGFANVSEHQDAAAEARALAARIP